MCFAFQLIGSVTLNGVFCVISPYEILNFYSQSECEDTRTVKKIFKWNPLTKRSQGRPKYRWEDSVKQGIYQMRVKNWITCVQDRGKWKDVVEKAITFNY